MDRDNRVLVITGTGDRFMTEIDGPSLGDITRPEVWDAIISEGRRVVQRPCDLETPIVAAVNGPATGHTEYALLADVIVASEPPCSATSPTSRSASSPATACM